MAPSSILAERLTAQALAGSPLSDPMAVAERLLAVQGQDPRGFRLAVRARTEGLTAADGLLRLAKRPRPAGLPPPRLLGAFDPVLLGWTSREDVLGRHTRLVTRNGVFHPFALVEGRAVAKWGWPRGKLKLEPLQRLSAGVVKALETDAAAVARFLERD